MPVHTQLFYPFYNNLTAGSLLLSAVNWGVFFFGQASIQEEAGEEIDPIFEFDSI